MILILIAFVAVLVACCYLSINDNGVLGELIAPFLVVIDVICLIIYGFACFDYLAAEHKANIINREYSTSYTQIEVFYASDVIDTVRELDRKRIELNGDLITGKQTLIT